MHRRTIAALGAALALATATSAQAAPATKVHGLSPYPNPGACHGAPQSGTLFVNSEVEPWVGDNHIPSATADPDALVGTWQQDRFSSGGSSGLLVAYSHDGGASWTVPPLADQPAITNCQDPDSSGANSDWERATDPWADISPNGDMWFMSLSFNDTRNLRNAMLVSKSEDGGAHWTEPVTLIDDANPAVFNDKNSLTADPNDSNLVYAVWDRLVFPNERTQGDAFLHAAAFKGPTYFSKTENGTDDDGGDWTTRKILDLGRNDQTIANQIAVLRRTSGQTESTLINVFDWIHNDNKGGRKGETSSTPTRAACARATGFRTSRSTWRPASPMSPGRTAGRTGTSSSGWRSRATTARRGRSSAWSTARSAPTRTRRPWRWRPTAPWP
jgi:hypothetical protein